MRRVVLAVFVSIAWSGSAVAQTSKSTNDPRADRLPHAGSGDRSSADASGAAGNADNTPSDGSNVSPAASDGSDARDTSNTGSASNARAATNGSDAGSEQNDKGSTLIPPRVSMGRVYYLPTVHYRSETGFGVGGEVLMPFRWRGTADDVPLSDVSAEGRITMKGQSRLELSATINWRRHYLKARFRHRDTAERFYGLGPNSPPAKEIYRPRRFFAYVEFFHRFTSSFKGGVRVESENYRLLEVDPNGLLMSPEFQPVNDKTIVGGGLACDWDTRDNRFFPTRGAYYQAFAVVFDQNIGSDLNVKNYHLDLRNYFSLATRHVLATQLFVFDVADNPPFWRLASLGGRAHTRAYHRDRFLDHLLVAAQAEYRLPPYRRFGTTLFAGGAVVSPAWAKLQVRYLRPTVGLGLNFRYGSKSAILARFDTAYGHEGFNVDFALTESF